MLMPASDDALPYEGRYLIDPDLPPPPPVAYDLADAVMEETHDLPPASAGSRSSCCTTWPRWRRRWSTPGARATHAGTIAQGDARRIGGAAGERRAAASGRIEDDERWGRALRGAARAARGVASIRCRGRCTSTWAWRPRSPGRPRTRPTASSTACSTRDLHVVVPAVRAALRAAGEGAVDEVVFLELLREQHRDVLLPAWLRGGHKVYPMLEGEPPRPYDDVGFDAVEAGMVRAALAKMVRMGVLRRAPGVFAGTPDGRRWAGVRAGAHPPIFVTGDLELIVPPDALTVWERFQIERLSPLPAARRGRPLPPGAREPRHLARDARGGGGAGAAAAALREHPRRGARHAAGVGGFGGAGGADARGAPGGARRAVGRLFIESRFQ
jgi:hypothetical protein